MLKREATETRPYVESQQRARIVRYINRTFGQLGDQAYINIFKNEFINETLECFEEELVLDIAREADKAGIYAYYAKSNTNTKVWESIFFMEEPHPQDGKLPLIKRITFDDEEISNG